MIVYCFGTDVVDVMWYQTSRGVIRLMVVTHRAHNVVETLNRSNNVVWTAALYVAEANNSNRLLSKWAILLFTFVRQNADIHNPPCVNP